MSYKHWEMKKDHEALIWLFLDREGKSANTLNEEVMNELDQLLDNIAQDKHCKGLIIASAKKSGFIMGADIEQFTKISDEEQAYTFIRRAHAVFDKLEKLSMPTVAMIKGFCLGGGCELSLACRYRVVEETRATRIGLPEVMLGIHPGWGGTVRLPAVVGGINAMDMMLTGRMIDGKKAYYMGLADAAVPERHLVNAARKIALTQPKKKQLPLMARLSNGCWMRCILANVVMKKKVAAKAPMQHYPAPYAILKHWQRFGKKRTEKAYEAEARSVAKLVVGETAQNLIRVFFLQDRMKKLGKSTEFKAKHVHVIGAGTMGGDIAAWCAFRGMTVTLQDREEKHIAPAIKRAYKFCKKKLKKPRPIQEVMDRLIPDINGQGVASADVVIEAIFENLEAKQKLFQEVESKMKPGAIMASNTSSIPLDDIAKVLKHPERLIGIHFFNPVAMMPLVEVVYTASNSQNVIADTLGFVAGQLKKQPVPVKSSPGFLVNRCLMPYLMEAVDLIDEGASGPAIDRAAKHFGMPMGPIELADTVGLDICLHVAKNLTEYYGGKVPAKLKELVDAGRLGKKSGEGFYKFVNGKAVKKGGESKISKEDITNRLTLRMMNECAACLREGIVEDKDLLDGGMIFGTGFAPFRGGPMHYADQVGKADIVKLLGRYEKQCGERFKADAYWQ